MRFRSSRMHANHWFSKGPGMSTNQSARGAAMLVYPSVAWGATCAVAKGTLGAIDACRLTAWRYVPASFTMVALLWAVEGRGALSTDGAALRLWVFGSLGFAGFSILGYLGLARSRPEHAAIIVALMPLFSSVANLLVRGSKTNGASYRADL